METAERRERTWLLGIVAMFLAVLSLGGVLAFRFPELLTTRDVRELVPLATLRALLRFGIIASIAVGVAGLVLDRGKRLSAAALAVVGTAWLLGGSTIPGRPVGEVSGAGLDWLILSIFVLAAVFVPLERAFPRTEQPVFRPGWRVDVAHFAVSHLLVQAVVLLTFWPAHNLFAWAPNADLQATIGGAPLWLQVPAVVLVADLGEYWIHRAMHQIPLLWRFHAIHHSSRAMDWLAGSRLHLVDIVAVRAFTFVPLFILGFSQVALAAYVAFVSLHAVFIHANVRFRFGWLEHAVVTPRFHHWHHAEAAEAVDKNFAVHLPWLDALFGTRHLPRDAWPTGYGIAGHPVPETYLSQVVYPLRRRGETTTSAVEPGKTSQISAAGK